MRALARRHAYARLIDRTGGPFQSHAFDRAERPIERRPHDEEERLNSAGGLEPRYKLAKAVLAASGPRKQFAQPVTQRRKERCQTQCCRNRESPRQK